MAQSSEVVEVRRTGLTVLTEKDRLISIDVIFVHSDKGHPKETWATKNLFWPEQVLPQNLPEARVLTFGYTQGRDASMIGTDLLGEIENDRQRNKIDDTRPIVFVCHGFGCLIVESALISSKGRDQHGQGFLPRCTHGLIFLGKERNNKKRDGDRAFDWQCTENFPHIVKGSNIRIECFYRAANNSKADAIDSLMHLGERVHSLHATSHESMCRFEKGGGNFNELESIIESIKRLCTRVTPQYKVKIKSPRGGNIKFHGRQTILDDIKREFWGNSKTRGGGLRRKEINLHGVGGAGKTQIAIEYMKKHEERYTSVIWLNVGIDSDNPTEGKARRQSIGGTGAEPINESAFNVIEQIVEQFLRSEIKSEASSYYEISCRFGLAKEEISSYEVLRATLMKQQHHTTLLREWLGQRSNNQWLLVLDNCNQLDFDFKSILPEWNDFGHVLILSNIRCGQPGVSMIPVPAKLGQQESRDLLKSTIGKSQDVHGLLADELSASVNTIIEVLGEFPIAITAAGSYLAKTGIPITSYAKSIEEVSKWPRFEDAKETDRVVIVYELAFKKLESNSKELVQLLCVLENDTIPQKLLKYGEDKFQWMKEDLATDRAIGELEGFSFVTLYKTPPISAAPLTPFSEEQYQTGRHEHKSRKIQLKEQTYMSMHSLVRRWVRKNILRPKSELWEYYHSVMIDMVTSSVTGREAKEIDLSLEYREFERRLIPHIDCCFEEFIKRMDGKNMGTLTQNERNTAYLFTKVYTRQGRVRKFEVLEGLAKESGVDQPEAKMWQTSIMYLIGRNLAMNGKYDDALEWYECALGGMKEENRDEGFYLDIVKHKAELYKDKSEYAKAIAECSRVLDVPEPPQSKTHVSRLELKRVLGLTIRNSGDLKEAEETLKEVFQKSKIEPLLGADHQFTLRTRHDIATILKERGKYSESLEIHNEVLEKQKYLLGDNHFETLDTLHSIGTVYESMGDYDKALKCNELVLERFGSHYPGEESKTHPWILYTLSTKADILTRKGNYTEAQEVYERAYEGFSRQGLMNSGVYPTATNLSRVLREKGQYNESLGYAQDALRNLEADVGATHLATIVCRFSLGKTLELQGKYQEASEAFKDVLESSKSIMGVNHHLTFETLAAIASVRSKQGEFNKAVEDYRKAWDGLKDTLTEKHPKTLYAEQGLAENLQQLGKHTQALEHYNSIELGLTSALGANHPHTQFAIFGQGTAYEGKKEYKNALSKFAAAKSGWENSLGKHPLVLLAEYRIANIHDLQGEYDQAKNIGDKAFKGLSELLGNEHPHTYQVSCGLAHLALETKDYDKADKLYGRVLPAAAKLLGPEHPLTLTAAHGMADLQTKRGNHTDAGLLYRFAMKGREQKYGMGHTETSRSRRSRRKAYVKAWLSGSLFWTPNSEEQMRCKTRYFPGG